MHTNTHAHKHTNQRIAAAWLIKPVGIRAVRTFSRSKLRTSIRLTSSASLVAPSMAIASSWPRASLASNACLSFSLAIAAERRKVSYRTLRATLLAASRDRIFAAAA
eukprot:scaffold268_cov236-Pinguiococcus_pyrenoidosus.AAC.19